MSLHILLMAFTVALVLQLLPFGLCQTNLTDELTNELGETAFPVITLGKDITSLYYANVSFGDPADEQLLRVDIGQPYTWLISKPNDSDTAVYLNNGYIYEFSFMDSIEVNVSATMDSMNFTGIHFTNISDVSGTYSIDSSSTALIGSDYMSISNISFFETNYASFYTAGSLGLGGRISDGSAAIDSEKFDSSFFFLDRLMNLGIIKTPSYSLWFGADTVPYDRRKLASGTMADCGKLILGAVDPSLYTGILRSFKMIPFIDPVSQAQSNNYPILPLGTIYINSANGKSLNMTSEEFVEPVLLDSRYSTTYLPIDAIVQIAVQIGATFVESLDKWLVACSVAKLDVSLDFTFGNIEIRVPLEDFLVTTYDPKSNTSLHFSTGEEACFLAMVSKDKTGYNVLGGPFLKNLYMAVDIEDSSIAIAQAKMVNQSSSSSGSIRSTSASSAVSSAVSLRPISSGHIPYALSRNLTSSMTLFPSGVPSLTSYVPDQFTGTVNSEGLISTGRSFYQTSRSTSTPKSSETTYESLLLSTSQSTTATVNAGSTNIQASKSGSEGWIAWLLAVILGASSLELLL